VGYLGVLTGIQDCRGARMPGQPSTDKFSRRYDTSPAGSLKLRAVMDLRTVSEVSDSVGSMEEQFEHDSAGSHQELATASMHDALTVVAFETRAELRDWLEREHARSSGIWVRLARSGAAQRSISFHDLLEEGLCFGWSESTRHRGDTETFLQKFTPRRTPGTTSERNKRLFEALRSRGLMTSAGETAMGNTHR